MNIDLNLLEYLLAFIECGSLSKASEKLLIAQPSLSKGMQKLEDELEISIFDRKKNKLLLNDNGEKILPYIKDIIEMCKRLEEKAKEIKENEKTISIGFTAPGPMYKFSNLFFTNVNQLKVVTKMDSEENLLKGLNNNIFDLIFLNNKYNNENYICEKVMTESLYISIPSTHFLVGLKKGVHWTDIDGQSFLLYNYTGCWEEILKRNLKKSKFLRSSSTAELKEIVEYSTIPSFLTNLSAKINAAEGRINIPILDSDATLDFYVLCKKNNAKVLSLLK